MPIQHALNQTEQNVRLKGRYQYKKYFQAQLKQETDSKVFCKHNGKKGTKDLWKCRQFWVWVAAAALSVHLLSSGHWEPNYQWKFTSKGEKQGPDIQSVVFICFKIIFVHQQGSYFSTGVIPL